MRDPIAVGNLTNDDATLAAVAVVHVNSKTVATKLDRDRGFGIVNRWKTYFKDKKVVNLQGEMLDYLWRWMRWEEN